MPLKDFLYSEDRYKVLVKSDPDSASSLLEQAQEDVQRRWAMYKLMAEGSPEAKANGAPEGQPGKVDTAA